MPSTPHLSLTQALRQHTRELHHTLDASPRLRRLLDPTLEPADYADSLLGLWQAHRHTEAVLTPLENQLPPCMPRFQSRLPSLECDLLALGCPLPSPGNDISCESPFISASPLGHYLGLRYVVEGASQGARLIAARLRQSVGRQGIALSYWEHQASLAEGWPSLCTCLDTCDTPDTRAHVLAGAEQAFHLFLAVFHEPSRQPARHVL